MEDDTLQLGPPAFQGVSQILLPEKTGVVEAAADHPLVAPSDMACRIPVGVGHGDEARNEITAHVLDGEAFLVMTQRRDQQLARQAEEPLVEPSADCPGPFHQIGDLVQERGIVDQRPTQLRRTALEQLDQSRPAFRGIREHVRAAQRVEVVVRVLDLHPGRTEEAVADGMAGSTDPEQLERKHLAPVQGQQPVHGADPPPGPVGPAHRLGERHALDGCREFVGEKFAHVEALDASLKADVLPRSVDRRSSAAGSIPCFFAKPRPARDSPPSSV